MDDNIDTIDAAIATFKNHEEKFRYAVKACEDLQATGKIGAEAYQKAKMLLDDLKAEATILQARIMAAVANL